MASRPCYKGGYYVALRTSTKGFPLRTYNRNIKRCQRVEGLKVQAKSQGAKVHNYLTRVAVKELKLSYYIGETLLFTIHTHYGNLIQVP